jgi:hypothetical protein
MVQNSNAFVACQLLSTLSGRKRGWSSTFPGSNGSYYGSDGKASNIFVGVKCKM